MSKKARQNKALSNKLATLNQKEKLLDEKLKAVTHIAMEANWETADPVSLRTTDGLVTRNSYYSSARLYDRQLGHYPPYYVSEPELTEIRETARYIEAVNANVVAILSHLSNYVIGTGFTYTALPKDGASPKLAKLAQQIMDEFWEDNIWNEWETELFLRSRRDGEYFLYFQDQGNGYLRVKTFEPEQVTEPLDKSARNNDLGLRNDDVSWTYGICADQTDSTMIEGYWVVSQLNHHYQRGEYIHPNDLQHAKLNVDRTAKRGVSDFFQLFGDVEETRKLLRNLRKGAGIQAAIAYIRKHGQGVTASQAQDLQASLASRTFNVARPGEEGAESRTVRTQQHDAPVIIDTKFGTEYSPGPLGGNSSPLVGIMQAALRSIGNRWGFPEGMASGDWSNNNFASALVAEGPFVKAVEKAQVFYKQRYKKVMMKVLEHAADAGRFRYYGMGPSGICAALDIQVDAPQVATRDKKSEYEINSGLVSQKVMSRKTFAAKCDLDYDAEQEQIAQEANPIDQSEIPSDQVPEGYEQTPEALIQAAKTEIQGPVQY